MSLLSREEVEFFKNNQHLITQELLDTLRAQGNEGKRLALKILDLPKNDKMFYLDAYGDPLSYEGNKGLKKPGTVLALSPIHKSEFERCAQDFQYFRENYIQIKTYKGIDFPDLRDYQTRLVTALLEDDNEEVVGLMGRQCVAGDTQVTTPDGVITMEALFNSTPDTTD